MSDLDKFVELYKGFGIEHIVNKAEDAYIINLVVGNL